VSDPPRPIRSLRTFIEGLLSVVRQGPVDADSHTGEPNGESVESGPLTSDDALKALDWEITLFQDDQKRSGTTAWALALALGAILWALVHEEGLPWEALPRLAFLIAGMSLLLDACANLRSVLVERDVLLGYPPRVTSFWRLFWRTRPRLMMEALRVGALCWLLAIQRIVSGFGKGLALVCYVAALVWFLGVISLSFLRVQFRHPMGQKLEGRWRNAAQTIGTAAWALPLLAAYLYWTPFFRDHLSFSALEYRVAGLVVAGFFVAGVLAAREADVPLLNALIQLRRDVAIGRVNADEAARGLYKLTGGLPVRKAAEDLLQTLRDREETLISAQENRLRMTKVSASARERKKEERSVEEEALVIASDKAVREFTKASQSWAAASAAAIQFASPSGQVVAAKRVGRTAQELIAEAGARANTAAKSESATTSTPEVKPP
jgi:hypothetical protein